MKRRVYYHDTDCAGVVYYGNYLKFLEEARTEYMEERGLSVKALLDEGFGFVVKRQEIDYKYPARYGDIVEIDTRVTEVTPFRARFEYDLKNQEGRPLAKAVTDMVCVGPDLKIREMAPDLSGRLR
ncbi:MAG: acyl-CoA thioester hydrolase [Elusimicrobia bacterium]|nr:MAG: acyl-CoA thioester hydrolase [Elusimicrobiota bacterium]KAF0155492.1 MAG: acyl-CoA thioester hydrolase [Elusimicrobiota bacterium]